MFIKPDYNLKNIYEIDLDDLKNQGINALLFDLDSTIMGSKTGCYTKETLEWLEKVKKDFFVGVVSNNNNPDYIRACLGDYYWKALCIPSNVTPLDEKDVFS